MKVAFIDDGVSILPLSKAESFTQLKIQHNCVVDFDSTLSLQTHGTICAKIFDNHVLYPYEMTSLNIMNAQTKTANIQSLIYALDWCYDNQIQLINLSIGTRDYHDISPLLYSINRLNDKNVMIVAACSNNNTLTFPACFDKVFGVRNVYDEKLENTFMLLENPIDYIELLTSIGKDEFSYVQGNEHYSIHPSNSYATPFMSAMIYNYLCNGYCTYATITQQLKSEAKIANAYLTLGDYKKQLEIDEIVIPIIVYMYDNISQKEKIYQLINLFYQEEFNCACLSNYLQLDIEQHIFLFPEYLLKENNSMKDIVGFYANFICPDVIILYLNEKDVQMLLYADIVNVVVLSSSQIGYIHSVYPSIPLIDASLPVKTIYNHILKKIR